MASLLNKKRNEKKSIKTTTTTSDCESWASCCWTHPSQLKASQYVDCFQQQQQQHEADENALNEALEAKLRQLIVSEYSARGIQRPVSLRIQGHLTISQEPQQQSQGTFWTADADICWRDTAAAFTTNSSSPAVSSIVPHRQRAERQSPVSSLH